MLYQVTHVSAHGATTCSYVHETDARSKYALSRADPHFVYGQLVVRGRIIEQFARHADTCQNMEFSA